MILNSKFSACGQSLIGKQPRSFLCLLSVTAFVLQQQSWVVVTEPGWPIKLNIFIIWPFTGKVC